MAGRAIEDALDFSAMNKLHASVLVCVAIACAQPAAAQSFTGTFNVVLGSGSQFEYGCYDPCACPITIHSPVEGWMRFSYGDIAIPPFTEYGVEEVRWRVDLGSGPALVRGTGVYRKKYETHEHQLTLDLTVDGQPVQHFDSGLVPRVGDENAIDIDISLHGEFCHDSVFRVRTKFPTGVPGGGGAISLRAFPNPFGAATEIAFSISDEGDVDVRIFDLAGRQQAVLASGRRPAGGIVLRWDGRGLDGRVAPAGVYLARVRAEGRSAVVRLARIP